MDPDRIEPHNLGEMAGIAWIPEPLGRPKVEVVREALEVGYGTEVEAIRSSALELSVVDALKFSDVLFSASDAAEARMAAAAYASLYCMPLIDVGSGVIADRREPFGARIGVDVRIVLPDRCLMCAGGLAATPHANALRSPVGPSDFGIGRLGSLRSLNAVGAGVQSRTLTGCV